MATVKEKMTVLADSFRSAFGKTGQLGIDDMIKVLTPTHPSYVAYSSTTPMNAQSTTTSMTWKSHDGYAVNVDVDLSVTCKWAVDPGIWLQGTDASGSNIQYKAPAPQSAFSSVSNITNQESKTINAKWRFTVEANDPISYNSFILTGFTSDTINHLTIKVSEALGGVIRTLLFSWLAVRLEVLQ